MFMIYNKKLKRYFFFPAFFCPLNYFMFLSTRN